MAEEIEYSGESVYVLRCSVGDTTGWYVGSTYQLSAWERISQHIDPDYDHNRWVDEHTITGIECVFEFGCIGNTSLRDSPTYNESFVARSLMERYSDERVYGGGYSKLRTPNPKGQAQPTVEFKRDIKETEWDWMLEHAHGERSVFYSEHSSVDRNYENEWRVLPHPVLE